MITAPHLHCFIHRCICSHRSRQTPFLLIRAIAGGHREDNKVSALDILCGMMLAKIRRMRGILRAGVEAQCHCGAIRRIISGSSSVYAYVHEIVIMSVFAEKCTVENLRAMMSGCFGD